MIKAKVFSRCLFIFRLYLRRFASCGGGPSCQHFEGTCCCLCRQNCTREQ